MPARLAVPLKRTDIAVAAMLVGLVLIAQGLLALWLDGYGVFSQYNVLFDTDPNTNIGLFAHGWNMGGFTHPLLPYYFSVPIRGLTLIAAKLGLVDQEITAREGMALFVAPLLSGLKAATLFLVFRVLGMRAADAVMASALAALGFSSLIFGSTPRSPVLPWL